MIIDKPWDEDERLKEAFLNLLGQACGHWDGEAGHMKFDSMCLSSYESALALAVEFGWIEEHQVTR